MCVCLVCVTPKFTVLLQFVYFTWYLCFVSILIKLNENGRWYAFGGSASFHLWRTVVVLHFPFTRKSNCIGEKNGITDFDVGVFRSAYAKRIMINTELIKYISSPSNTSILLSARTEWKLHEEYIITYISSIQLNSTQLHIPTAYISNHSYSKIVARLLNGVLFSPLMNSNLPLWRFDHSENSRKKINWYKFCCCVFFFLENIKDHAIFIPCVWLCAFFSLFFFFVQLISVSLFICSFKCKHLRKLTNNSWMDVYQNISALANAIAYKSMR